MLAFVFLYPAILMAVSLLLSGLGLFGVSIYISIVVAVLISLKIKVELIEDDKRHALGYILIFSFISFLVSSTYFLFNHSYSINDVHAPFGSIESGRYVNISRYIDLHNTVPYIKQNFGQSILMTHLHRITGVNFYAVLALLVAFAKAQLMLIFFLMLRHVKFKLNLSLLVASLILFHSISFGVDNVIASDTGFPLGLTGYFDPVYGVTTLIIFGLVLGGSFVRIDNGYVKHVVLFLLAYSWLVYAPQNIFIFSVFACLQFALDRKKWMLVVVALLLIILGRYTPGFLLKDMDYFAAKSIDGLDILVGKFKLVFNPGMDVLIFNFKSYPGFVFTHISHQPIKFEVITQYMFVIIDRMMFAFKEAFLVLVVFFIFIRQVWRRREFDSMEIIFIASGVVFAGAFLFEVEGMKWQMSRFAYPIYILSIFWLYGFAIKGPKYLGIVLFAFVFPGFYDFLVRLYLFANNNPSHLLGILFSI